MSSATGAVSELSATGAVSELSATGAVSELSATGAVSELVELTPERVAARCAGEAQNGVAICACSVRSRLQAGWSEDKVLDAYFARDRKPTPDQVRQAQNGLDGVGCLGTEYFLFSSADMRKLGLRADCAVATGGGVWAFGRDALNTCRGKK